MKRRHALLTLLARPRAAPVLSLQDTMLATAPANLVALWPLNETSGTVATDVSGNGRNGTYSGSGVTLNQALAPFSAPTFDGTNGFVNIYSASLAAAFNSEEGTVVAFARRTGTDTTARNMWRLQVDAANSMRITHTGSTGLVRLTRTDATPTTVDTTISVSAWSMLTCTWSLAANVARLYRNATQVGSTANFAAWPGALAATTTLLGAQLNSGTTARWLGQLAFCGIWNTPLTAGQIAAMQSASGI